MKKTIIIIILVHLAGLCLSQSPGIAPPPAKLIEIGKFQASDPEGQPLTFTITSLNINKYFAIDSRSGVITAKRTILDSFKSERTWVLTVKISDGIRQNDIKRTATITIKKVKSASGKTIYKTACTYNI